MATIEFLMLIQTLIMFGTGIILALYTMETRRLRRAAGAQFQVMQRTLGLQLQEEKRAAEPVFNWGGGSSNGDHVEWEFTNEGGSISYLTITMQSPSGVRAEIRPSEWLGTSRKGIVTFDGNVIGQLRFTVGFRTRIGGVAGFFFLASRTTKPTFTGSGEL
jgi:hypothetical protein